MDTLTPFGHTVPRPKSIAVFIDGTGNSAYDESAEHSNVFKLFNACALPVPDKHYFSGVGALGPPPDRDSTFAAAKKRIQARLQFADSLVGGVGGLGLARRIKQAYAFVCERYRPGDSIYLFGFSRGAYAARSLAGFVNLLGLLLHDKLDFVETAFTLYQMGIAGKRTDFRSYLLEVTGKRVSDGNERGEDSLPIYFIGVWDTVCSLGLPRAAAALTNPFTDYHMVTLPPNVTYARHALALHEPRREFPPVLWAGTAHGGQDLIQCFFPGAHADVGGGYLDTSRSDVALSWMARHAEQCGLPLHHAFAPLTPATTHINCELKGLWRLAGGVDRDPLFTACKHPFRAHVSAQTSVNWSRQLAAGVQARLQRADNWRAQQVANGAWPFEP